ncbi:MAG: MaoC family dehydratase [Rhodococcus sp. (in: high G+C Gram-positive bacteria)]
MTTTLTHAQLIDSVGSDLGTSEWIEINQVRIDGFAEYTEDRQWIHTDRHRAAEGPFGTTIAHGFLTLALVPHLLGKIFHVSDETRGVNYGLDKVRFTNPVPVDSHIRLKASMGNVSQRQDGGVTCHVKIEIEIKDVERPAMVGEFLLLSYCDHA